MVRTLSETEFYHTPEAPMRSYRKPMKPLLSRKATSSARINLNRFWNELEEFYDRFEANKKNPALPAYTTDVWDHEREAAENALNERMEKEAETKSVKICCHNTSNSRGRLESHDVLEYDTGSETETEEDYEYDSGCSSPVAMWNLLEKASDGKIPAPPPMLPMGLAELIAKHQ